MPLQSLKQATVPIISEYGLRTADKNNNGKLDDNEHISPKGQIGSGGIIKQGKNSLGIITAHHVGIKASKSNKHYVVLPNKEIKEIKYGFYNPRTNKAEKLDEFKATNRVDLDSNNLPGQGSQDYLLGKVKLPSTNQDKFSTLDIAT